MGNPRYDHHHTPTAQQHHFLNASRMLYRGVLDDVTQPPLSPASLQASRLCANSDGSFTCATGVSVFHITCDPTRKRRRPDTAFDDDNTKASNGKSASNGEDDAELGEDSDNNGNPEIEADEYLVPKHRFSTLNVARDAIHSTHETEVQSVVSSSSGGVNQNGRIAIASVDMCGRCIISRRDVTATTSNNNNNKQSCYTIAPISRYDGMPGWAGVTFLHGDDERHTVIAREMFRDVSLFDGDMHIRTLYTTQTPQAIQRVTQSTVAVVESGDISLYDIRSECRGPSIRKQISQHANSNLLCMDVSLDGNDIVTAGVERVVHVLDVRVGLNARDRWAGCLKNECAGIALSSTGTSASTGMAYVSSTDNEVACGAIEPSLAVRVKMEQQGQSGMKMMSGANARSGRRLFGFRADVRLTGMARRWVDGCEDVAVTTEANSFYILRSTGG